MLIMKKLKHKSCGCDIRFKCNCKLVFCINCNKKFYQSTYASLCDAIMQKESICSYECNKALGQMNLL